ncbi:MAG TPA: DUF420 domain-containing protein [Nitrospirae bacterium]|nr:DUF420 domain-containing protein [Nitrospirota bacterium]
MLEVMNNPGFLSSRSTLGSDVSYLFAVVFTLLFLISGVFAKKHKGLKHHRMILVSMSTMFLYFIYYYKIRRLGVSSMADEIVFSGPDWVYQKVFRPALMAHFMFVTFSISLAVYMIANGFKTAVKNKGEMTLKNARLRPSITLWALSLVWLAFLAWWLFFVHQFGWGYRIMFLALGYFIPAVMVALIQKTLPESEKRHRVLGAICIGLFAGLLVTSTLVYCLLYVVEY